MLLFSQLFLDSELAITVSGTLLITWNFGTFFRTLGWKSSSKFRFLSSEDGRELVLLSSMISILLWFSDPSIHLFCSQPSTKANNRQSQNIFSFGSLHYVVALNIPFFLDYVKNLEFKVGCAKWYIFLFTSAFFWFACCFEILIMRRGSLA